MENTLDQQMINDIELQETKIINYQHDLDIKSSESSHLIDSTDRKYLDFTANNDNNSLGFTKNIIKETLDSCSDLPVFLSENYKGSSSSFLTQKIKELTGHSNIYTTESIADAKDAMLQMISTWAKYNDYKDEVIVINAFGSTQSIDYYKLLVKEKDYNKFLSVDLEFIRKSMISISSLKNYFSRNVAAVIIDTTGIIEDSFIIDHEIINCLRSLCDKNNALLILNASDIAPGRTGKLLTTSGIVSDVAMYGIGWGQGISMGLMSVSDTLYCVLKDTYKHWYGTPVFACCIAENYLKAIDNSEFFENIDNLSQYLYKALIKLQNKYLTILDIKYKGLYFVIEMDFNLKDFVKLCFDDGLVIDLLDSRFIKLTPPFNITYKDIDFLNESFDKHLSNLKSDYCLE
ncbi:MAG: aminotransferase class III-fold pyridoxal phosphate-dependent enzyme [Vampirovibrionia bacterium]